MDLLRQGDNLLCILNLIIEFYLLFVLYLFFAKRGLLIV